MASESKILEFEPHVAAQMVSVKLTARNYSDWKSEVVPTLKRYNMFNIVPQTTTQPLSHKEENCPSFIKLTLSMAMVPHAVGCSTPRALWLKLEHQTAMAQARVGELISRLKTMKKGRLMSVSSYYYLARRTADQLEAEGCPVYSNGKFLMYIVKGLPAEYALFDNLIGPQADAVTPDVLLDLLLEFEASRKRQLQRQVFEYGMIVFVSWLVGIKCGYESC